MTGTNWEGDQEAELYVWAIVFKKKVIILYIVFTIIYKVSSISYAQHPTRGRGLIGRSPGWLNNDCLCTDASQCPRSPLLGHLVMDVVNIATQRWQHSVGGGQCSHSFPRPERWPGIEEEEHGHHLALVSCSCLLPIIIGAVNRVSSVGS